MCNEEKYTEVDCALRNLFEGMDIGPGDAVSHLWSFLLNVCEHLGVTDSQFREMSEHMMDVYTKLLSIPKEENHE